jgi:RNA polymerase sigma-70 factor, ECF subfamily
VELSAAAFADLVREHQAMVFSIAYRFLRDSAAAEELAQDAFLKLHHELPRLESPDHVKFWLRKVIMHRSLDYARSAYRRHAVRLDDIPEPALESADSDPLLTAALRKMVASLPNEARMMVVLRYQEEMEPHEIAEMLAIPVATVKSRLRRTLALLRGKAQRLTGETVR